jgi:hypothetical protein
VACTIGRDAFMDYFPGPNAGHATSKIGEVKRYHQSRNPRRNVRCPTIAVTPVPLKDSRVETLPVVRPGGELRLKQSLHLASEWGPSRCTQRESFA